MPTAAELLMQLCLRVIGADPAPKGVVIRLHEMDDEPNWTARSTAISVPHLGRLNSAIADFIRSYPMVDWSRVETRANDHRLVLLASLVDIAKQQEAA